jgi:hypothetical protein
MIEVSCLKFSVVSLDNLKVIYQNARLFCLNGVQISGIILNLSHSHLSGPCQAISR